jgi:hypothetical protein
LPFGISSGVSVGCSRGEPLTIKELSTHSRLSPATLPRLKRQANLELQPAYNRRSDDGGRRPYGSGLSQ